MPTLVVSACLLGKACRYDGASKPSTPAQRAVQQWREGGGKVVEVCPEELGDLGTPRPGADLRGGDGHAVLDGRATVRTATRDVTEGFVRGAQRAAERAADATEGILKARSPSCGCGVTEIDGGRRAGDGVFAALLRRRGVQIRTDEDLDRLPVRL